MNPFKKFKSYIAGKALANASDEFERASINLLYDYCVVLFLLAAPFIPTLYLKGLMPQFWINVIAFAFFPLIFFLLKNLSSYKPAAISYIIVQFGISTAHLYLSNFQPSVQSLLWCFLHINFAFFVLGGAWGFTMITITIACFIFGVLNQQAGFAYINSGYKWDELMSEKDLPNVIIPFVLNGYILYNFVRTRKAAEKELRESKMRSEELLLNILPAETAQELKLKGSADAKYYEEVTVLFADIRDFSHIAAIVPPQDLVNELHHCFKLFDEIITEYDIEKIKTIGDAYLCASGVPSKNERHALDVVKAAIEMNKVIKQRNSDGREVKFEFRIGIHTGPIVAGVVGIKKFAYDIWGDTVNIAARMQQMGEAGRINVSESTYAIVKNDVYCDYRGELEVKNKGHLKMYFVQPSYV